MAPSMATMYSGIPILSWKAMDLPLIMDTKTSRIQEQAQYLFHQEGKRPNLCIQSSYGSFLIKLFQKGYCAIFCPSFLKSVFLYALIAVN